MNALNNVGLNKIYLCTWYKTFLFWLFICYWYYLVTFKAFIRIYQCAMSFYLAQWEYEKHFSQKKSFPMKSLWPKLQNEMKTWISLDKFIRTLFQNIPSYSILWHNPWRDVGSMLPLWNQHTRNYKTSTCYQPDTFCNFTIYLHKQK